MMLHFLEREALEQTRPSAINLKEQLQEGDEYIMHSHSDMFGIVEGALREKVAGITLGVQPNPSTHIVKRFNFLPEGFLVRPEKSPQLLVLPSNHSIILHHTVYHGNGAGERSSL